MRKAGTGEGRRGDRPQLSEAQVRHLITQVHLSPIDVGMRGPRSASPDRPGLFTQYPNRGREILKCLIVKDEMGENNYWKHIYLSMYFTQESSEICSHQKLTGLEPGKENFQRTYYYCFVFCLMY